MGVDFQWRTGDAELLPGPPEPPRRRRGAGRWLLIGLVVLLVPGGLVAWRAGWGARAARADIERLVREEVAALQGEQLAVFMSLIEATPLAWRRYHEQSFFREAAWYAARARARPRVERIRLAPGAASADIVLSDGTHTWRGTWYFERLDERWYHVPPPADFWGQSRAVETAHVYVSAHTPDHAAAVRLAEELEALYQELARTYGLVELPGAGAAPSTAGLPRQIAVHIVPDAAGSMNMRAMGTTRQWSYDCPSPYLALELWTPQEREAYLGRSVRAAVASHLVTYGAAARSGSGYTLLQGLALWHARAWQPAWQRYVRESLSEGTWELFLALWGGDQVPEERMRELYMRFSVPYELGEWVTAMAYTAGEYLGNRFSTDQLASLVAATARYSSFWAAAEAELGLDRSELEAEWLAHLRARYGGSGSADEQG